MKRLVIGAAAALGAVAAAAALMLGAWSSSTAQAITGPNIAITNVHSIDATHIGFDVATSGAGFSAYAGFNLEITWDGSIFTYSSASTSTAGDQFAASALCPGTNIAPVPAPPAQFDQTAGTFLNTGCTSLGPTYSTGGTLLNVVLNVVGTGCSNIHLVTFGAPDGGDSSNGSYTIDGSDFTTIQTNTYTDAGADNTGATCTPVLPTPTNTSVPPTATDTPVPPTATDTPVPGAPTNTPTATNTAAPTNTPGAGGNTATPVLRTVTPSPTVGTPSANTPVPAATSTTAPGGGGPGGVATAPGGGPGGVITGPNTGTGAESAGGFNVVMAALLAAVAMLVVGSGAGYAWWRRAQGR